MSCGEIQCCFRASPLSQIFRLAGVHRRARKRVERATQADVWKHESLRQRPALGQLIDEFGLIDNELDAPNTAKAKLVSDGR
jgi:hypothetical protein